MSLKKNLNAPIVVYVTHDELIRYEESSRGYKIDGTKPN